MVIVGECLLDHVEELLECLLFNPGEVDIPNSHSFERSVFLGVIKHLLQELGVWNEEVSLLLKQCFELDVISLEGRSLGVLESSDHETHCFD